MVGGPLRVAEVDARATPLADDLATAHVHRAADVGIVDPTGGAVRALLPITSRLHAKNRQGVTGNGTISTTSPLTFSSMAFDAGAQMRFGLQTRGHMRTAQTPRGLAHCSARSPTRSKAA